VHTTAETKSVLSRGKYGAYRTSHEASLRIENMLCVKAKARHTNIHTCILHSHTHRHTFTHTQNMHTHAHNRNFCTHSASCSQTKIDISSTLSHDLFSFEYLEQAPQSYPWSYTNPCPIHPMHNTPASSSGLLKELQEDISAALLPGRACHPLGLQGIAITHCTVTQTDIKYICDLLEPVTIIRKSSNTPRGHNDKDKDKDDSSNNSKDTNNSKNAAGRPRGLRYLDLGFNRMGCTNCSEVLRAAARGNLECLDLAGNFSHRGGPFLAAIVETLTANSPVNNNLSGRGDNDDYSSDGGSDDGINNNSNSNYSNSNSNSNSNSGSSSSGNSKVTMKSLSGASRTPRNTNSSPHDTLSLHLPKHIPLQYTCHLKHLVSPPTPHCAVLHHTTSQPCTEPPYT
jgi:hypothetical protein